MRRWLLTGAALLALAGCTNEKGGGAKTVGETGGAAKSLKVAEVTDVGGIDDKSFNALAWSGLQKAKELGCDVKYLESREQADYKEKLSTLAEQGNDLVFAIGFLMEDAVKEVAPAHANTKFAIVDGNAPGSPNCASLKFREEEGSFLAGYLAGKMSKTGAIGFVGGLEVALIKKFEAGYRAGARTARPDIRVIAKYANSFTDAAKGKEYARTEMDQGADIIFHAAGKTGLGVLDAVAEKGAGYYGIGVDKDQDGEHPGRVLTSMMKGVDVAVFDTVKNLKDGKWAPGEHVFGLKEGAVHLSPMQYTRKDVPPAVLADLDTLTKMVADGKIAVPKTEDELQNFQPPKLGAPEPAAAPKK